VGLAKEIGAYKGNDFLSVQGAKRLFEGTNIA